MASAQHGVPLENDEPSGCRSRASPKKRGIESDGFAAEMIAECAKKDDCHY